MKITRKKIIIFAILGIVFIFCMAFLVWTPQGKALRKSKSHFRVHAADSRVLYEPGAEEYADKIAEFLPTAIERVEKGHFLPFKKSFKVYVCRTQKSHNEFVANPTSYPIRGSVLLGNVFIAPSAFSFKGLDTHKESLMHELSHLHLRQRLGFFKSRKIPSWFSEGLANFIAGSGGEGISEEMAVQFIKEGRHISLQEKAGLLTPLTKIIRAAGLSGPMYHKQNTMFMSYIHNENPEAFKAFVLAVQDGEAFLPSFITHFGMDPQEMWNRFEAELLSTGNIKKPQLKK